MARVGVFDSGVGGLTVLRALTEKAPTIDTTYLGDTARVPYGIRSARVVTAYALENARFLLGCNVDILVIACNTATAVALEAVRAAHPEVPVIGVVEPGARAAVEVSGGKAIGVLATEATIASGAYQREIEKRAPGTKVHAKACPLFVPLAEEGWVDNDVAELTARHYLEPTFTQDLRTLVLGCTHYPLLAPTIQRVLPSGISLVDSANSTASEVLNFAARTGISLAGSAQRQFFVTDAPERFARVGERFLGAPISHVEHVDLFNSPFSGAGTPR